MTTSIGPSYDPTTTATALAEKYTSGSQAMLTTQTKDAGAAATALTALKSAISNYQTSLSVLTASKTLLSRTAIFSNPALGVANASPSATAGSYSFFVERLATASQVAYAGLADSPADGGTLDIKLGGTTAFTLALAGADADANGTLTPRELATAINNAPGNSAKVSASVVTINNVAKLVLTAKTTGLASDITLDASGVLNGGLKAALSAAPAQMTAAQDALVWLGAQGTGSAITQSSNTFSNIADVSMTFTKAQAAGDAPVTLTVGSDSAATTAKVQSFVDAYNRLKGVLDGLVDPGDPSKGKGAGAFAHDSGVRALHSRLISALRPVVAGGATLAAYGVVAARDGSLSLDATRLTSQLALNPQGLDQLIGNNAAVGASGIAGNLDTYLKQWSSATNGQIKQRQDANAKLQATLTKRQSELDGQYDSAYQRYLAQFTKLQTLQSTMASNTSLFDAMFGNKST